MISKIPNSVEIPLKKQAPRWRLTLSDWVLPALSLLIPCLVMAIDNIVYSLTSSPDSTALSIILIPALLLLKSLLTKGKSQNREDPPHDHFDDQQHQQSTGVPIYTESGELLNNTLPPCNMSADPHDDQDRLGAFREIGGAE